MITVQINVRIPPSLDERLRKALRGDTLNDYVTAAIEDKVRRDERTLARQAQAKKEA